MDVLRIHIEGSTLGDDLRIKIIQKDSPWAMMFAYDPVLYAMTGITGNMESNSELCL